MYFSSVWIAIVALLDAVAQNTSYSVNLLGLPLRLHVHIVQFDCLPIESKALIHLVGVESPLASPPPAESAPEAASLPAMVSTRA